MRNCTDFRLIQIQYGRHFVHFCTAGTSYYPSAIFVWRMDSISRYLLISVGTYKCVFRQTGNPASLPFALHLCRSPFLLPHNVLESQPAMPLHCCKHGLSCISQALAGTADNHAQHSSKTMHYRSTKAFFAQKVLAFMLNWSAPMWNVPTLFLWIGPRAQHWVAKKISCGQWMQPPFHQFIQCHSAWTASRNLQQSR